MPGFPEGDYDYDRRPLARGVRAPTLVVHGAEDPMPLAGSEEWARTLPAAKLLVVPEAGHYPHAELGGALLSCRRALPKRFLGETLPGSYQQPGGLTMFNAVRSLAHPLAPELVKLGGVV